MKKHTASYGFIPLPRRLRAFLAVLCLLAGLPQIWFGLNISNISFGLSAARAGDAPQALDKKTPAPAPEVRAQILQAGVDGVALSLSGALAEMPEEARRAALGAALDKLTFELGGEVFFAAFEGSRMVHAPYSPDAAGLDFADALDETGRPFVQNMRALAEKGGFVPVRLPGQFSGGAAGASSVAQQVYARAVPGSSWFIAAFMRRDPSLGAEAEGFSSVWSSLAQGGRPQGPNESDLKTGLCLAGFSCLGFSGLLCAPGRRREEEEAA